MDGWGFRFLDSGFWFTSLRFVCSYPRDTRSRCSQRFARARVSGDRSPEPLIRNSTFATRHVGAWGGRGAWGVGRWGVGRWGVGRWGGGALGRGGFGALPVRLPPLIGAASDRRQSHSPLTIHDRQRSTPRARPMPTRNLHARGPIPPRADAPVRRFGQGSGSWLHTRWSYP